MLRWISAVVIGWSTFWLSTDSAAARDEPNTEKQALQALRGFTTNVQFNRDQAKSVRLIRFSKAIVTDEKLAHVRHFSKLDYLAVVCPKVTDAGVAHISGLTNLDTLVLSGTQVSDRGLAHLRKLSKLEHLYLANTKITDAGLEHLAGLTSLKTLDLTQTRVTGAGLGRLKSLARLEVLLLDGTGVGDPGLKPLRAFKNLRMLSLAGCPLTGKTLGQLAALSRLKHLTLTDTQIDRSAIDQFGELKSLAQVELYRVGLSAGDVARLRGLLPKTGIHVSPATAAIRRQPTSVKLTTGDKPRLEKPGPILESIQQRVTGGKTAPPDFQRHVIPLLGRLGCNGRACHGSFQGQGGFRLSMFGYDFAEDHKQLLQRVDLKSTEKSLILNKPADADEHGGGLRLPPRGWERKLLRRWIAGGAKGLPQEPATFVRLDVSPAEIVFAKPGDTVQLKAVAVWSDGSREDVTCLTRFTTKDESIAAVSPSGLVRSVGKGDTHVISFYDNGIVPTPVMLPVSRLHGKRYPRIAARTAIDRHVIAKLRKLGIRPSGVCTDEEFLRRVSLDMIGTLPTPSEISAFVADTSPDKRRRKIDELLERPAYATWWTTRLCDLTGSNAGYLGNTEMAQPVAAQWRAWIERRVQDNVGWDKIVSGIVLARSRRAGQPYREFIAEQSAFTRRRQPADYAAAGNPMPHFWARSNIIRPRDKALAFGYTFMGVRLDCAQCHKHPFDQWSKQDFDQFTRLFARVKAGVAPDAVEHHNQMRQMLGVPRKLNTAALRRQSYLRIAAEGRPIPWREIYIEAAKGKAQPAKLLGGAELDLNRFDDPREPLMRWLLNEPNRYLAKAFVNRIWANYFHRGIISPPDDLNLANPPANAALLDGLVAGFIKSGYDMKWLHRTIANSDTYQRSWRPNATNKTDERNFSRAVLRRLPAEVAIDAIVQATANARGFAASRLVTRNRKIGQHPKSYQARAIDFSLLIFGKPLRTTNCDCERQGEPTLLQSLYVRNDQEMLDRLDRPDGWLAELKRKKPTRDDIPKLVREAYLRVLSRHPDKRELKDCRDHLATAPTVIDGLRDLLWALMNTQEFISNH